MSDQYDYSPPESMRSKPSWKANAIVGTLLVVLTIAPPLLWWGTGNENWLWGWVLLLILGLAG